LHDSWWVPRWKANGKEGEVFVFENGSLVCWGLDEKDARTFAKQYIARVGVEVDHLIEPETEDVEFVTDPNECVNACFRSNSDDNKIFSGKHVYKEISSYSVAALPPRTKHPFQKFSLT
jgi:uncharacterized Rmd1/YagE family protein